MSIEEKNAPPSAVEIIKGDSRRLRGAIAEGLDCDRTAALRDADTHLIKFHGIYQQDDRDVRQTRAARKLEPAYSFMVRLRVPGGLLSPRQWLTIDAAARELTASGGIRLTTRQTVQFHGAAKENLRPLLQAHHRALLDSIAACGDVNRNVMCAPYPSLSPAHRRCYGIAVDISRALLPNSRAYHEIWLGEEQIAGGEEQEPLYGEHYLPRKFKIAVAVPPINDVDVYSQDIGFVAVVQDGVLVGFNVVIGGGLGMTHNDARTRPHLAKPLGFCAPDQAAETARQLLVVQRDYGARHDRKIARFKYTVARLGVDFVRAKLQAANLPLSECRPVEWTHRGDVLGWRRDDGGDWLLGLRIENGRIRDDPRALKSALREVAGLDCCGFLITPNQNLLLVDIADKNRRRLESVFARRGINTDPDSLSGLRKNAMACVALPTCPLAMAEAERFLPSLTDKLESHLAACGLAKDDIIMRMTGCPNGCARPYLGEIGLVGKSPGRYNLYLGASFNGDRLSALCKENLNEEEIIDTLKPLFAQYAEQRQAGEHFGDFLIRAQYARAPQSAADFHYLPAAQPNASNAP